MSEFHFLRPIMLLLFIPFLGLLIWMFCKKTQSTIWNKVCSKDLLPYVLTQKSTQHYFPSILFFLLGSLLITALAGPSWQLLPQPLFKTQSGLVITLDLSPAMNAEDIKPSRLQRALYKLDDLLTMRKEGQTALIVFSDESFVVTPLTDDVATIKSLLSVLETKIMPTTGHQVDKALIKASELLTQAGLPQGSILLVTSELSKAEMEKSIEIAKQKGLQISVLGVGSDAGALIPLQEGGFLKDERGSLLHSKLSKENLSFLANSTHGSYATISNDDRDLNELAKKFTSIDSADSEDPIEVKQNQWHDQGYLLVLAALPLALLFFRRGMLLFPLLLMPHFAHADTWSDLWKTPDQQAQQCFQNEQFQEAKERFQNSDWQAATNYRLEDYAAAAELYQQNQSADGLYNYGTAKAKAGDLKSALEAYNKALELQPDHEDALYNKSVIEKFNQQQQQNQKDKSDQKDQSDQSEQSDQSDKSDKSDQKDQSDQKDNSNENGQSDKKDKSDQKEETGQQNEEKNSEEMQQEYRNKIEKEMQEKEEQEQKKREPSVVQEPPKDEQKQMDERMLERINDDPGGLLRRKFQQQYLKQKNLFLRPTA